MFINIKLKWVFQIFALHLDINNKRFAAPLLRKNIDMFPPELFVSPDFSHRRLIIQEFKVKTGEAAILHFLYEQGVEPFFTVADGVVFAKGYQVLCLSDEMGSQVCV